MLSSRQKKEYLILVIFAVGWRLIGGQLWYDLENVLWKLLVDTIFGQGIFSMLLENLFPRFMKLFGFYILAIGSTCIAICSEEKQKKFLYLLSLALIALWIAVPFFDYLTIKDMSYWRPNMARSNFIPLMEVFFTF